MLLGVCGGPSLSGRPGQAVCLCSPSPRPSAGRKVAMGGRGKGYGKGRHGKSRRSLEDEPLACEKKIVNCLRHGSLGMSGFFLQGGYFGISERAFQAALDVDARNDRSRLDMRTLAQGRIRARLRTRSRSYVSAVFGGQAGTGSGCSAPVCGRHPRAVRLPERRCLAFAKPEPKKDAGQNQASRPCVCPLPHGGEQGLASHSGCTSLSRRRRAARLLPLQRRPRPLRPSHLPLFLWLRRLRQVLPSLRRRLREVSAVRSPELLRPERLLPLLLLLQGRLSRRRQGRKAHGSYSAPTGYSRAG